MPSLHDGVEDGFQGNCAFFAQRAASAGTGTRTAPRKPRKGRRSFPTSPTERQTNSLHVEYAFGALGKRDCPDISTENDSFCFVPAKENVITRLAFATEEIYLRSQSRKQEQAAR